MSNSETIESEIRAEFCDTVSCRFSRTINQSEFGRKLRAFQTTHEPSI
jgi:hypothetical protein